MINFNLYMGDRPLWYRPAIGPEVAIGLSYNSRGAIESDSLVGNKWQLNYQSFLQVDSASGKVTVTLPDGGKRVFTPNTSGGYTRPYQTFYDLVRLDTGANNFELRFQSGGAFRYTFTNVITGKTYLTAIRDDYGQQITFNYWGGPSLTSWPASPMPSARSPPWCTTATSCRASTIPSAGPPASSTTPTAT